MFVCRVVRETNINQWVFVSPAIKNPYFVLGGGRLRRGVG